MVAEPVGGRSAEDLTARARIRDAAIQLFTERGIEATTIRDIAKAAGVSSGLIRHHFGAKEALRDACDTYVLERIEAIRGQLLSDDRSAGSASMVSMHPVVIVLQNYLTRSMMDGSAAAARLFDEMIRQAEEWIKNLDTTTEDLRAFAAVLVTMQLGVFLLSDQMTRALGVDVHTPEGHSRMLSGFLDVFTVPLLEPELLAQARVALSRLRPPPAPTTTEEGHGDE